MKTIDLIQETYLSVMVNKIRSSLTILGIVIGIGSVIAMVSVGQGAQSDIESNIQSLGSNLLMVMPGAQRGVGEQVSRGLGSAETLVMGDAEAIKNEINNVVAVASQVSTRKQVTAKGTNTNTSIYGVTAQYPLVKNVFLSQGSFITEQQVESLAKVAVLGPIASSDLFGESNNSIGQKLKIENQIFTVIGVTQEKGGTGFGSSDDLIYIPLTTAQRYLLGSETLSTINVQVADELLMTFVEKQINSLLLRRHNIADPAQADFSIMNQADIISTMSSVTGTFTLLLGAIAGISLLVGGIGIMNMMLTTVTERTREIGLRKYLGAKNKNISTQFLAEAVSLTFTGGIIGVAFGWLLAYIISRLGSMTTQITLTSVLLAFCVSAVIGVVFGYYPARRAAKLNPIEALRYE